MFLCLCASENQAQWCSHYILAQNFSFQIFGLLGGLFVGLALGNTIAACKKAFDMGDIMRRACSQPSNKTRQTTVFFGKVIDLFNEDPQEISHLCN